MQVAEKSPSRLSVERVATIRDVLERLYFKYNHRRLVQPDPLQFLYRYSDPADVEIVGLLASALAYGRVQQIEKSLSRLFEHLGRCPSAFVREFDLSKRARLRDFKHRFTTGDDVALMLLGARRLVERYGSLEGAFRSGLEDEDETVLPALRSFTSQLNSSVGLRRSSLVPMASSGSACKRINLFLRWMVRRDNVDPGGWNEVPASKLIVPLDVHMHRLSLGLGLTKRRQANMLAALDATAAFRAITPEDPVRYDFSRTRLGIREELEIGELLGEVGTAVDRTHS